MLFVVCCFAPCLKPFEVCFAKFAHNLGGRVCADGLDDGKEVTRCSSGRVEAALKKTGEEEDIDSTIAAIFLLLEAINFYGHGRSTSATVCRLDESEDARMDGIGSSAVAVAERVEMEAKAGSCIDEQETPVTAGRCVSWTRGTVAIADGENQKALVWSWYYRRSIECGGTIERDENLYDGRGEHVDAGSEARMVELSSERIEPFGMEG